MKKSEMDMDLENSLKFYLDEIGKFPLLTKEEEIELAAAAKTDAAAKERFVNSNLRLVVSIAKRFDGCGLPLLDLVQEGNLGLLRAVDEYKPELGHRFSTYATWWIRQAVAKAVADQGRLIRLPAYLSDRIRKMNKTQQALTLRLGYEPGPEEVAAELKITVDELFKLTEAAQIPSSLDVPAGDGDTEGTVGDMVIDEGMVDPAEIAEHNFTNLRIAEAMDALEPREKSVLYLRFGLDGEDPMTLEKVGKKLNISRERARQIEIHSLRKICEAS